MLLGQAQRAGLRIIHDPEHRGIRQCFDGIAEFARLSRPFCALITLGSRWLGRVTLRFVNQSRCVRQRRDRGMRHDHPDRNISTTAPSS